MLADQRLEPLAAVAADHRPELERAEAPAERGAVVHQVRHVLHARAQVLGQEAERVAQRPPGRRVKSAEQSTGVKSHLCGLTTSESARSTPSNAQRSSGQTIAEPAYAASTWSQAPCRSHRSAIAGTGSTDVVDVVPTVATTTAASSRRERRRQRVRPHPELLVHGHLAQLHARGSAPPCRPRSARARSRGRRRPGAVRARRRARRASRWTPCPRCGRAAPRAGRAAARSQSIVSSSSSVAAGPVRQSIAFTFSAADEQLREDPRLRARDREVGEEARVVPVRRARDDHLVEVAQDRVERLGLLGRRGRELRAHPAGSTVGAHRVARGSPRGSAPPTRARRRRRGGSRPSSRLLQLLRPAPTCACSRRRPSSASRAGPGRRPARGSRARGRGGRPSRRRSSRRPSSPRARASHAGRAGPAAR